MERKIYLDHSFGRIRAAIVEDGVLCELLSERISEKKLTETLFLGRVLQIRPSVGAAFVDIGEELNAFLPIEEKHSLRCGDMIVLQGAAKQATETKGLRVTTRINLPGKWLVLAPGAEGVHISKKIKDAALRKALEDAVAGICPPDCGLIVRTASQDVTKEALKEEAESLYQQWKTIRLQADARRIPGILNESLSLDLRIARDWASNELSTIATNDHGCYERLLCEQSAGRIPVSAQITFFQEKNTLLFDVFGIDGQIDKALKKRVWLPCGGYLIIDPCEALTVIDVNSGKMMLGKDTEDTALSVNLEAADEIARQIRLRGIGGIIIVDFIDMKQQENRELLIARMKEAVKSDRNPVKIEGITKLGLLEMTRKRVNDSLMKTHKTNCTYCAGSGLLLSPDEVAQRALRQIRRMILSGHRGPFVIHCAPLAASALSLYRNTLNADIFIASAASKHAERFDIEQIGENEPVSKGLIALKKD